MERFRVSGEVRIFPNHSYSRSGTLRGKLSQVHCFVTKTNWTDFQSSVFPVESFSVFHLHVALSLLAVFGTSLFFPLIT